MRVTGSILLGGLALTVLALPAAAVVTRPASETQYTFDFTGSSPLVTATAPTNVGGVLKYDKVVEGGALSWTLAGSTVYPSALSVTATGWTATAKTSANQAFTVSRAAIADYSGGLGITSVGDNLPSESIRYKDSNGNYQTATYDCGIGDCGTHQIDNVGNTSSLKSIDFVELVFSSKVILGNIGRTSYGTVPVVASGTANYGWDTDMSYGSGTSAAAQDYTLANLQSMLGMSSAAASSIASTACEGTSAWGAACLDTATINAQSRLQQADALAYWNANASTTWHVSADLFNSDGKADSFKITNMTVLYYYPSYSNAPEPASWAMMVGGFGMIGGALRRRRAEQRIAAAR